MIYDVSPNPFLRHHKLKMSRTARRWTFTVGKEFADEPLFNELPERAAFIIWQLERAPSTNYLHFQGYIRMQNACTIGQVKALFPNEVHLEQSKGTEEQNIEYCSKQESKIDGPWTLGNMTKQGSRTDLEALARMVTEGKSNYDIASEEPTSYARYANHLKNLRTALQVPKRCDNLKVYVLIGLTGTGKTHWAYEKFPDLYVPIITKDKVWWDGYSQSDTVLFDDYRGEIQYSKLLTLLDKYPKTGEIKGGSVALNYQRVIITSNHHFSEWYPQMSHSDLSPLHRRCQTGGIFEIRTREDLNQIQIE